MRRALLAAVEAAGGWGEIIDRIASGETLAAVGRSLGYQRQMFSKIANEDPERKALLEEARRISAAALADECLDIADSASPSIPGSDRIAALRINTRRWLASRHDPGTYGEQKAPLVQINAQMMHLDALRQIEAEYDRRQIPGFTHTAVNALPSRVEVDTELQLEQVDGGDV